MSKKTIYVIFFIVVVIITIIIASFTDLGSYFKGQLFQPTSEIIMTESKIELPTNLTRITSDIVSVDKLRTVEQDTFIRDLSKETFKYVDVATNWLPGSLREESNKELFKIFPFPSVNEQIGQIDKNAFKEIAKWEHVGVKGVGVIFDVDYSQQDYKKLLMSCGSGVYKTSNFGESWAKIDNIPDSHRVFNVAIDPNDANHFLVISGVNLYESFDTGNSWQLIKTLNIDSGNGTKIHWNNSTIFINKGRFGFISSDNGLTWNESTLFNFHSNNMQKIYQSGNGISHNQVDAISVTSDFGHTWEKIIIDSAYGSITAADISENGQNIIVAFFDINNNNITFGKSYDAANTWEFVTPTISGGKNVIQDIKIDNNNPDHFFAFMYMVNKSLHESYDGGQTLITGDTLIQEIDSIFLETSNNQGSQLVIPLDMRVKPIKKIAVPLQDSAELFTQDLRTQLTQEFQLIQEFPIQEMQEPKVIEESIMQESLVEEIKMPQLAPTIDLYLIPSDHGLYAFNDANGRITNIAKNIYMAQTGQVSLIESCPRIYSGFWHVGHFYIDYNGVIKAYRGAEKFGGTPGEDVGCNTEVLYSNGTYTYNGGIQDWDISSWIWNSLNISSIGSILFEYNDNWWYAVVDNDFIRIDLDTRTKEVLFTANSGELILDFYIEDRAGQINYWLLTEDANNSIDIYHATNPASWSHYKSLATLQNIVSQDQFTLPSGHTVDIIAELINRYGHAKFIKEGNQIIISGEFGVAISNNDGASWEYSFEKAETANIVKDSNQRLFIGLKNGGRYDYLTNNNVNGGVWYSVDNGETWSILEPEAGELQVTGVAIDNTRNVLYASTSGESLVYFNLNMYNLPPVKTMEKFVPDESIRLEEKLTR